MDLNAYTLSTSTWRSRYKHVTHATSMEVFLIASYLFAMFLVLGLLGWRLAAGQTVTGDRVRNVYMFFVHLGLLYR